MFCTQDAKLFVPHGRLYYYSHPGSSTSSDRHLSKSASQISLHNFKNISLTNQIQESWQVQRSASCIENCDEELYFKDNLLVWSRSIGGSSSQTLRTFTMDSPVIKALWCNFIMPSDKPPKGSENSAFYRQSCVCVVEDSRMSFFCDEGQNYTSHIPMPVKNVWPIQNGLLFERCTVSDCLSSKKSKQMSNKTQKLTTIFSLIHPLDELVPVVHKTGLANQALISFITDVHQEIVFTSESPSIAVTFHHESKKHSVWNVRWTSPEEVDFLVGRSCGDITGYASPNTSKAFEAQKMTPKPTNSSGTLSRHTFASFSPCTDASHLPSLGSKISSPSFGYSHLSSPNLGSKIAALDRTRSPSIKLNSPMQSCTSPSFNHSNLPSFSKAPFLDAAEPLAPETCLAHVWTEPIISREGDPASKVFFTCDFNSQQFLCLLIGSKQHMKFIKFEESNEKNFVFGNSFTIHAKDAVPLPSLQLLVVLDLNNILLLYSGPFKMNVIHISGLMSLPHFNYSSLGTDIGPTTSSRPASSMDVNLDDVPISPVAHELPSDGLLSLQCLPVINAFNICSLRDPVENRFTIELLEGELCRVEMPEISSSSLVSLCLLALKSCLPEPVVLKLFSKWYVSRNSPGLAGSSAEWTHFASFVFTSLGYSDASQLLGDEICNLSPKSKKRRMSVDGSDSDWMEMLQSKEKKRFESSCCVNFEFATSEMTGPDSFANSSTEVRPDSKAFLHPYVLDVFFNLHLVYEEVKLDSVLQSNMIDLAKFLCHLSQDLDLHLYSDHYCRDHPSLFKFCNMRPPGNYFKDAKPPSYFSHEPPHILQWIYLFLTNHNVSPFPNLPGITFRIQQVILMFTVKFLKDKFEPTKYLKNVNGPPDVSSPCWDEPDVDCSILLMALSESGMQAHLPPCLIIPVIHAIHNCRKNPPKQWTEEAYKFIGREDLAAQCRAERTEEMGRKEEIRSFLNEDPSNKPEGDGMDRLDSEVLKLRFSKDLRVKEIKKLLQSSVAIKVALQQKLGVSDHEFIDEQEKFLYAVSARTMALPVGRGMLTYGTYVAVPTEALPIPKLCLSGRVPPRNNIIEMTHIELPSNLTEWPQFHNGVAAGLRLTDNTKLDSTWILFNKLKSENMTNEHAGFLMGQGLTGHLSGLACLDVHDYLIKGNEMISIGLLLGMSADKRGTMDMTATKTLSIHISALLPPSSAELDVLHNIQVASVLGIGLVYQSSAHRHISEVLLSEIGRPPGPEMENSVDRESYSLAAGLALGNVMLAKGTELLDVSGSEMPDYLYYYMNGRKRKPMSNSYKERYKATSCQIKEGECVNTDVTAPGAIVALGLMFFNSGNASIADWLVAPDTPSLLECMMPDLLMLRTIGYGLIMWQSVVPTDDWINSNIPEIVKECAFDRCQINENPDCNVDIELMSQAYVNIIAGGCMVIGLKYAGSANKEAFECLYRHFQQIFCWQKTAACIDYAGKYTLEQCLCLVVLCMAMVMAGTGDLTVLRICRHLRARIAPHVHYGSHMIVGMACGLLVLGGGKCTLSSKPEAVAAMLCAFFPKFPIHANDNRFHLQAFRHLYVLAVEKRILIPCDVDTNKACYAELQLVHENNTVENVTSPCLLPELESLKEIRVWDQDYWHIEFKKSENWDSLKTILSGGGRLFVKQRINHSLQSKYMSEFSIEGNEFLDKIFKHKDMVKSRGSYLAEFSKLFIQDTEHDAFSESSQLIFKCLYNKISEMLPIQVDIHQNIAFSLKSATHPFLLWQFRILCAYHDRVERIDGDAFSSVSKEFLIAMQNSIEGLLAKCLDDQSFRMSLYCYLTSKEISSSENTKSQLSSYLTWFSIPHPKALFPNGPCSCSFSSLYCTLKDRGLSVACIKALSRSMEELQRQK